MDEQLGLLNLSLPARRQEAVAEIMKCNASTARYGLVLSFAEAVRLAEARETSLQSSGRIEVSGGLLAKLIGKFCDSPYISKDNYMEILQELMEMFYFYKNETLEIIGDEDLLQFMKDSFNGKCQGSLELLRERELDRLARSLRYGYAGDYEDDESTAGEDEDGTGED